MICTLPDEAACEKLRWFLRKSVLFFVALSATFFHFFIKATLPSLFYLPIAYGQLAACLAGFAPADGIGQFKLGNAEVFEQVPDVRMVVNGQHDSASPAGDGKKGWCRLSLLRLARSTVRTTPPRNRTHGLDLLPGCHPSRAQTHRAGRADWRWCDRRLRQTSCRWPQTGRDTVCAKLPNRRPSASLWVRTAWQSASPHRMARTIRQQQSALRAIRWFSPTLSSCHCSPCRAAISHRHQQEITSLF